MSRIIRIGTIVASVLVVAVMLFAVFAVMTPRPATNSGVVASLAQGGATSAPAVACGEVPVPLHSVGAYAVLASSTVTSTGATALTGNLGLSPGTSVTGFPPGTITGLMNVTSPAAAGAEANLTLAFNNASARSNCAVSVAGNIGGETLTPGLYKSTSSLAISSGDLTLSGGGNPNGVFIFQIASTLTTTSGRAVILSDGAQAGNVFWEAGSSVTLGTTSTMMGTVMAADSLSMLTGSTLDGRALAVTGGVSLEGSTIVVPTTTSPTTYPVTFTESGLPAATSWSVALAGSLVSSTTTTVAFGVLTGTYGYTVTVLGFIATPGWGNVTVGTTPVNQAITCVAGVAGTFAVNFTETGLPTGTGWSVTMNGVLTNSVSLTTGFQVGSGTYGYTTGQVSNYTSSPSSGSVTVNGADQSPPITYTSTGSSNGTTSPPGNGNGTGSGLSSTDLALIAVGVVVAAAVIVGAVMLARRSK
jgi:Ice-binding-like